MEKAGKFSPRGPDAHQLHSRGPSDSDLLAGFGVRAGLAAAGDLSSPDLRNSTSPRSGTPRKNRAARGPARTQTLPPLKETRAEWSKRYAA